MSKECYDQLVAEIKHLVNVELPNAKNELSEARDKGDLSENFEYHAAKRAHGKLLSKIRFKQNVLKYARVLDVASLNADAVGLLRKVVITNMGNNAHMTYTIVNPHEADLREGKISVKSPIAESLMGKKVGDVVEVHIPAGILKLRIDDIYV